MGFKTFAEIDREKNRVWNEFAGLKEDVRLLRQRISGVSGASDPENVYRPSGGTGGASGAIVAGQGLTGGGVLPGTVTINVGAGDGINVAANEVLVDVSDFAGAGLEDDGSNNLRVKIPAPSGITRDGTGIYLADSVAGSGLGISSKVLAVNVKEGIEVDADSIRVDEDYAFTWTAEHTFQADIQVDADIDFVGYQKITTTAGNLDITPASSLVLNPVSDIYLQPTLDIHLDPIGDNVYYDNWDDQDKTFESSDYVSGLHGTGWGISWGTSGGHLDIRSIYADELHVAAFIADIYSALAGALIITKSRARVSRDFRVPISPVAVSSVDAGTDRFGVVGNFTNGQLIPGDKFDVVGSTGNDGTWTVDSVAWVDPQTYITTVEDITSNSADGTIHFWATLYVEDHEGFEDVGVFIADDYVLLRIVDLSGGGLIVDDVYGQVTSYSNLSGGEQSWVFTTTTTSFTSAFTVYTGSVALDYGQLGSGSRGVWMATVLDAAGSPYSQVQSWDTITAGEPSNFTTHVRSGNIDGLGVASGTNPYGIAGGEDLSDATKPHFVISDNEAKFVDINITLYDSAVPKILLESGIGLKVSSGVWGPTTTTFGAIFNNDTAPAMGAFDAGDVIIGRPFHSAAASQIGIHWDNSASDLILKRVDLKLYSGTTQTVDIQADGDIYFGSNVSAVATRFFTHFGVGQVYNGETVTAGDIIIGNHNGANMFWDVSAGVLEFRYHDAAPQVYIYTDGRLYAGAGAVYLDSVGIRFQAGDASATTGLIRFEDNSNVVVAYMYAYDDGSTHILGTENRYDLNAANYTVGNICTVRGSLASDHIGILSWYDKSTTYRTVELRLGGSGSANDKVSITRGGDDVHSFDSLGRMYTNAYNASAGHIITSEAASNVPYIAIRRDDTSGALNSGAAIGYITFYGWDGSAQYNVGARIASHTESTFSTSNANSNLRFYTIPSGSESLYERVRIRGDGQVVVGAKSNYGYDSKMNYGGLHVSVDAAGGANHFSIRHNPVSHGITAFNDTEVYYSIRPVESSYGGAYILGMKDPSSSQNYRALLFAGFAKAPPILHAVGGRATVEIWGYATSGTTIVNMPNSNSNVFAVGTYYQSAFQTKFIVAADGDLFAHGSSLSWYDDYDDVGLLHGLRASTAPAGSKIRERFGEWVDYARPILEREGLVNYEDDGSVFVNVTGLQRLTIDAVRQLYEKMQRYEKALLELGVDPKLLEMR